MGGTTPKARALLFVSLSAFGVAACARRPPLPAASAATEAADRGDSADPPKGCHRLPASLACEPEPPAGPDAKVYVGAEAAGKGSLDKEVIRAVILSHTPAVRACYEATMSMRPYPEGRVFARFAIDAHGRVRGSCLASSTLNRPDGERCVLDEILGWKFPEPDGGGWVVVQYPFVFGRPLSGESPDRSQAALASGVIAQLVAGEAAEVAGRLHEPAKWDPARVARERQELGGGLAVLMNEFGRISSPTLSDVGKYYEIEIAGGDAAYWRSLPNAGIDSKLTYRVRFAKAGPGILVLGFTRTSGVWELASIALGLEPSGPHAKEQMARIGRTFLRFMIPSLDPDGLEKALSSMFTAAEAAWDAAQPGVEPDGGSRGRGLTP